MKKRSIIAESLEAPLCIPTIHRPFLIVSLTPSQNHLQQAKNGQVKFWAREDNFVSASAVPSPLPPCWYICKFLRNFSLSQEQRPVLKREQCSRVGCVQASSSGSRDSRRKDSLGVAGPCSRPEEDRRDRSHREKGPCRRRPAGVGILEEAGWGSRLGLGRQETWLVDRRIEGSRTRTGWAGRKRSWGLQRQVKSRTGRWEDGLCPTV